MLGFGLAWPFNIYKSAVSKTAAGKSFLFTITIALAYLCGIIHKIFYSFDAVFWLYVLDFLLVAIDLSLMIRNRRTAGWICGETPTVPPLVCPQKRQPLPKCAAGIVPFGFQNQTDFSIIYMSNLPF